MNSALFVYNTEDSKLKEFNMFKRSNIIRWHMLLASFLLPLALIYFISGALYTLDIKGSIQKETFSIELEKPFKPDLEILTLALTQALNEKKLFIPDANPILKKQKSHYKLKWSDLKYSVTAVATKHSKVVKVTHRQRSLLTQLMRIHRAEAGSVFKVFSLILVIGLILLFASGVYMALSISHYKRSSLLAMFFGLLTFIIIF